MARTTATPTILTADSGAANLTALGTVVVPTTGVNNGVQFSNIPGQTLLAVTAGTWATSTATVNIGQTVLGQTVTSFTVNLTASVLNLIGPFHSVLDQTGTANVAVDFTFGGGTMACGVIQIPGVY